MYAVHNISGVQRKDKVSHCVSKCIRSVSGVLKPVVKNVFLELWRLLVAAHGIINHIPAAAVPVSLVASDRVK